MSDRAKPPPGRRRYLPVIGPRLRPLLFLVLGLFALLAANSVYLGSVTALEAITRRVYQDRFYLAMFMAHLALGALFVGPVLVFGVLHTRKAWPRPNRRAVRMGVGLFVAALLLLASGLILTRLEGILEVKDPALRSVAYWVHVISPLVAAWLFILHRLAGKRIRWRVGITWAAVAVAFTAALLLLQVRQPQPWNVEGNPEGEQYFFPSLSRTLTGEFIPAPLLMADAYCKECHGDIHETWSRSVHRFSSFNNPPYLFSVRNTRAFSMEQDGDVRRARFCAGCHDPVPFFSGRFNDPDFDDINDPTAQAGITCTACHAITHINSPRGNGDYTLDAPVHYPFAFSDSAALRWINRQLVKAKPAFHKKTFLKPLHRSPEFCGTCHKVHLPEELNGYKWLRGQNHYDAFLQSGVSGHGITSFYYPPRAEANCNSCHMPLLASDDFGARERDDSGVLKVHDHLFPSANTAIPLLTGQEKAAETVAAHQAFLEGVMRLDLFGVREGGTINGRLLAPLRPKVPVLAPGHTYLLETVIRTLKMGHIFTQGTSDSNQVWVEVTARSNGREIGRSGAMDATGRVDPWSHFVNAFVLDREGRRIDRRNPEDIFVPLYNHQIPPGAADTVHYLLQVPQGTTGPITVHARLLYRKFDTDYMRHVYGPEYVNDLPVTVLAEDQVVFPVGSAQGGESGEDGPGEMDQSPVPDFPRWQRWNDYGIGLLRKGGSGELRQAEEAFTMVEQLGRPDGAVNLARVYLREGRVAREAPEALRRAAAFDPPAVPWTVLWLGARVSFENGDLDGAIRDYRQILAGGFAEAQGRDFDFSLDTRLLNALGQALYERARQERGAEGEQRREEFMRLAAARFTATLAIDPEDLAAHYNLARIHRELGQEERAEHHTRLHEQYRPDDNARDRAIAAARHRYPAASHAAEAVVIYDLAGPEE